MDPVLRVLLTNAAAAGALAVAAWIASRLVRRPALVHALWLVALLRLLAPPLLSLPILPGAAAHLTPAQGADARGLEPQDDDGARARAAATAPEPGPWTGRAQESPGRGHEPAAARLGVAASPVRAHVGLAEAREPSRMLPQAALTPIAVRIRWAAWPVLLLGAAGVLALSAWRHARFSRLLQPAEPAPAPLVARARALAFRVGLRRPPAVLVVAARLPPLLWPTFGGPRLLLPGDLVSQLTGEELDALLVHELAHVRRRDHWVRLLEITATALFWWYPLAWWVRRALRRAEERCCDEWVLRILPGSARAYASGLLKSVALVCGDSTPLPASASGAGPVRELASRLEEILMTSPSSPAAAPVRIAMGTLALAGLMVFPTRAASTSPQATPPASTAPTKARAAAAPLAPLGPQPSADRDASVRRAVAAALPDTTPAAEAPTPAVVPLPGIVAPHSAAPAVIAPPAGADPVPPPPAADPMIAPQPARPAEGPTVVRISVERIQLDAVITDKKGRHVTDLTPADLEVYQDGRAQRITDLSYVRVGTPAAKPKEGVPAAPAAAGRHGAAAVPAAPHRTILFVVDEPGLSAHGFDSMHRALQHAIPRLEASDRVDVVSTVRGFGALAPTTDRTANLAAVAGLRRTPWSRTELSQLVAAAPLSPAGVLTGDPMGSLYAPGLRSPLGGRYDGGVMFDLDARLALRSIGVVKDAVRALRGVPGRKALLLVSEGLASLNSLTLSEMHFLYWPLDRLYGDADDLPGALKRLAELAARAGVVIDVVDPRGLVSAGLNAEDKVEVSGAGLELGQLVQARHLALLKQQSTLQYLADQTGGLALVDTNDVAGAVGAIVDDLSGYYLIGYAPATGTFDERGFHSFQMKVKRPGLKVRTRKGFYAVTDEQVSSVLP